MTSEETRAARRAMLERLNPVLAVKGAVVMIRTDTIRDIAVLLARWTTDDAERDRAALQIPPVPVDAPRVALDVPIALSALEALRAQHAEDVEMWKKKRNPKNRAASSAAAAVVQQAMFAVEKALKEAGL